MLVELLLPTYSHRAIYLTAFHTSGVSSPSAKSSSASWS